MPSKHALYSYHYYYYHYFFFFRSLYCPGLREATSSLGGGGGGESLFNWYYTLRKIYLFGFWFQFLQVDDTHQNYNVQIF